MITWWHNFQRKRFYTALFRRNSVRKVFDIGANEGVKSRLFLSLGATVTAVEPLPVCCSRLRRLEVHFSGLTVVEAAVSETAGTARLHVGSHSEVSTLSEKMVEEYRVPDKVDWDEMLEVHTITLDELFALYGRPDFLKLDCEGHDYAILKTLCDPLQLIEFEFLQRFTHEATASMYHLTTLGDYSFNFSAFESAKWMFPNWVDAETLSSWLENNGSVYIHGNIFAQKQLRD